MDSVTEELDSWLAQMPNVRGDVEAARQRIGRLARLFVRLLETATADQNLSISDLETLSVIRRNGGTTSPGRIADELQLTSGSVSTRLRRLERAGLAEADSHDPQDGRSRWIRLTDDGVRTWREGTARRTAQEEDLFAVLDEETLAAVNEALATLLERFEQEFGITSRHDRT